MWVNIQRITRVPHCANVVWPDLVKDTSRLTPHPQSRTAAASLPTLVDCPTIVPDALTVFGEVLDPEAARRHCAT